MVVNTLKEKLKKGIPCIGTFFVCDSPDMVELTGIAGFDFCIIDGEHGPLAPQTMLGMVRAAELRGMTPIIRIPNHLESSILHNLDIGAHGIQVPQVNTYEQASQIVKYAKYEPIGRRGVAFPRAADFGLTDLSKYFSYENEQTMIITHCENKACLENLEKICTIPEIDVIFLGPYDMSQSLGITGQVTHPLVEEAAEYVVKTCQKYGKIPGIFCGNGEIARKRAEQGFLYLPIGMDVTLFGAKMVEEHNRFHQK